MLSAPSDVVGFYAALGVDLPPAPAGTADVAVACFVNPSEHRHDDRAKSASVSVTKGCYRCHGCGAHGGAYDAAVALGKTPADAMNLLRDFGALDDDRPAPARAPVKPAMSEAQASAWSKALLGSSAQVKRLGELRGWSSEAIERLGVGVDRDYSNPQGGGPITFPARDEAGVLTGCIHYAPDPAKRNGGSKSIAKGPRQLYPRPESIEGDTAWIVEGEPDAVAAHSIGLPAVGVPGVESWKDHWAARFGRFQRVIVCVHDDAPGEKLAGRLGQALAAVVKIGRVNLGSLADERGQGYDLTDACLEARENGGVEHLRTLLTKAVEPMAVKSQPPPPELDPAARESETPEGRRITLTTASNVEPEVVRWAWEGRVPLGALSLIAGQPGLGKSTATAFMAARLSRGELEGSLHGDPCDVLLVTLEDHIAAVVRPRLEAAGADLGRVHFLGVREEGQDGLLTLPDDLQAIEEAAESLRARLLVIDPIVATLSKSTDAHKDQSVRRALAPLAAYAERAGIAVMAVMHLNKQEADGLLNRVSGSVGFGGAARAVLGFLRDPDDTDGEAGYERLLLPVKCNWGRYPRALKCRIESASVETRDGPSSQSLLGVIGESDITQADLTGSTEPGEGEEADEFLDEQLGDGQWHPRKEIKKAADAQRLASWKTVERAAKNKGVERARKGEFHAASEWRLPLAPTPVARVDGASGWRECENGSTEPNAGDSGSTRSTHADDGASGEKAPQIELPATAEQEALAERLYSSCEDW
jgi:hypothetical protein